MKIENVMKHLQKDINFFYVDIVDVKIMPNSIDFFAESPKDIEKHRYIRVSRHGEDVQVEIHTDNLELLDEVIEYLRNMNYHSAYLLLEESADIDKLSSCYSVDFQKDHSMKDYGVYGVVRSADVQEEFRNIEVCFPSDNDIEKISQLPNKEWIWLPQRIQKMNRQELLIAKKDEKMAGYLAFGGGVEGYLDIAIVFVHSDFRKQKISKALVHTFAQECEKQNVLAYYGVANSFVSSLLAQSVNAKQIREPNQVFRILF